MTRSRPLISGLLATALALSGAVAQASTERYNGPYQVGLTPEGIAPLVTIRDDVGLAGAAAYVAGSAFNGIAALATPSGFNYCTGVLISPTTVLSARHCDPLAGELVRFGTSLGTPSAGSSFAIQSVLFPGGGTSSSPLLNGGDIAILTLGSAVPASIATPFVLTPDTTSLVGSQVTVVGYGRRGPGSTGATGSDGVRRGGTNVLERYGQAVDSTSVISGTSNLFSTDFDNPAGTSNTLAWLGSSPFATAIEASTASGDSGGPMLSFIGGQWAVMGVLSGGTFAAGGYGDISWWTGVLPFQSQIQAAGGVFLAPIPEPGTYAMMALGLLVIGSQLRRRRAA
jgi:hypothetical protein